MRIIFFRILNTTLTFFVTASAFILSATLSSLLFPYITQTPYIIFIPGIIISTAYGGYIHGLISVFATWIWVNLMIISPGNIFNFRNTSEILGSISYLTAGILISWLIDALKRSRDGIKKFYSAFEQAGDAIFITDKHGIIRYLNHEFEIMSGYKEREAIGSTPRIVKSGKQDKAFYERMWKIIKAGKIFRGIFINRKKTGELFYADHTITPIKNTAGMIINYVGIWKDITKQRELEKRRDDFVSIASHELKTPLTSIKGYVQILREKLKGRQNKKVVDYINRMEKQVNHMTNLVIELLNVSRIAAGKLTLQREMFSLPDLVNETIDDIKVTTDIKINYKHEGSALKIYADRERISQVIKNLLANAIKFSGSSKKIVVMSRRENINAIVSIQDFGIGIAKEDQNKIFQRFYRIQHNTGTGKDLTSFGIGLYIAYEIMARHSGKIWVISKQGEGATFCFSMPIIQKKGNTEKEKEKSKKNGENLDRHIRL